ncbi:MAG: DNA-binding response regulator [Armatimonadota bacterium]
MNAKILLVDDDRFLLDSIGRLLIQNGYEVRTAPSGEEGLNRVEESLPDLMVLDLGLPGIDGVSLCRRIRSSYRFPIIMLTARTDAIDKVIGLEVGADDYLTKPFDAAELLARIRAQLRRSQEYQPVREGGANTKVELDGLTIDFEAREASIRGKAASLTAKEFDLLSYLVRNAGRALSREQLFETVWGYDIQFSSNTLDVFVYRLRSKIEDPLGRRLIHTVRGYGYKFLGTEPAANSS